MRVLFTGSEAKKENIPFLIDASMRPVTAVNAWLRSKADDGGSGSLDTLRTYAYEICNFFDYLETHEMEWENVHNDTIVRYRDVQDQNPSAHTKGYLSRRTINARLLTVGRFYSYATDEGLIAANPIRYKTLKLAIPKDADMLGHLGRTRETQIPSAAYEKVGKTALKWRPHQEVMTWLNSIEDWPDKLFAKVMYRTANRRKEMTDWRVWQLPERESDNLSRIDVPVKIKGKGGRQRLIYLATRDFIELHDYINIYRKGALRGRPQAHDYLFVTPDGRPLKPYMVNRMFGRISKGCGLWITPHMLRHSFAVTALAHYKTIGLSRPDKALQQRLGHANVATTQIYTHVTDEMRAEEAKANADLIEVLLRGEIDEE
jgi:site-specific recombinase XerD